MVGHAGYKVWIIKLDRSRSVCLDSNNNILTLLDLPQNTMRFIQILPDFFDSFNALLEIDLRLHDIFLG